VSGTSREPARANFEDETRFARLHLRVGLLVLARSELEDLERRALLDTAGRASLAEARWRAGDLEDAATAARAHLEVGGSDPVSLCIAAEAASADGRPGEARALMDRLGPPDAATLDRLFAGMPRRGFWPSIGGDAATTDTLFGDAGPGAAAGRERYERRPERTTTASQAAPLRESGSTTGGVRSVPGPRQVLESTDPGLWPEGTEAAGDAVSDGLPALGAGPALDMDPILELTRAREELSNDPDRSLMRLALVLRIDPTLAPAVLDAISLRREPAAELLRGDAQRLLGRHLEAEAAFARTADWLDEPAARKPS